MADNLRSHPAGTVFLVPIPLAVLLPAERGIVSLASGWIALFARFGGEEFVAILPGSLADATVAAQRVRLTFQGAAGTTAGSPVATTVSVGAASAELGADIAGLLTAADQALYRAKANGRNRVEGVGQKAPALTGREASALTGQAAAVMWHVNAQPSPAGGG